MSADAKVFIGCLLVAAFLGGMASAAESDEKKWERLAAAKEKRRAIEVKYENCMATCRERCAK